MLKGIKATFDKGITAASVKSGALVESSRTRTAITSTQKRMDEELSALGVLYFNGWVSNQLSQEALDEKCRQIKELQTELVSLQTRLEQIKEEENQALNAQKKDPAGDVIFCVNCGRQLNSSAKFCDACGTPVQR